ncbi:hypothetical protein WJX73_006165 [Symbiochloris irregularis]|uniref:AB hydrolase-1 domain-containing protein n=1 Tax=Symbiochloris irregularis TaxID=706552 RepID=A0AAW1NWZ0_9CHLO
MLISGDAFIGRSVLSSIASAVFTRAGTGSVGVSRQLRASSVAATAVLEEGTTQTSCLRVSACQLAHRPERRQLPAQMTSAGAEPRLLKLARGGCLSYCIYGSPERSLPIFWLHGIMSSRFEALAAQPKTLETLDAFIVALDRPGYGHSTPQQGFTYDTFVQDILHLADHLAIGQFHVVGVSGGGPYALACTARIPHRIRGVLLISSAGYPGWLTPAERREAAAEVRGSWLSRAIRKAAFTPAVITALCRISQTFLGGRLLFEMLVKPLTKRSLQAMAEVDRQCLLQGHPEYLQLVRPESLRQRTAVGLLQDLRLFCCPWAFSPGSIPPALQQRIQIWHGTNDLQVPVQYAHALKRLMPEAQLRIAENGGHFSYFVCDSAHQQQALKALAEAK